MTESAPIAATPRKVPLSRRAYWIKQITLWHWVSSGICLGGMLLFTVTGITLNHAAAIPSTPVVTKRDAVAPASLLEALKTQPKQGRHAMPLELSAWLGQVFGAPANATAEWSEDEVYVSLPKPGGDAWITVDRESGATRHEVTDRGWISYLNDLHKGRHTGFGWQVYIDVLAAACLVFSITGLVLLQVHASKRPSTWPLIAFSVVAPIFVLLLFVHS